jgi:ferredoxin-NADP reductase/DMSO/TMAO reductase YedYZ heme-binding membrane subunit
VPTTSGASPLVAARAPALFDSHFARWFVALNAGVPGLLLLWDAFHGQLGVNAVNFAIRSTGLLGLTFLVLSLVVTPLRRLTGWTWLVAARRPLGLWGFGYIAVHFAIFFGWDRAASVESTVEEIVSRPYLTIGFGALLLMIPLAITSTDGMVTRLGPRRWKALHRLSYLIVLGGVVHYYLLVKSDVRNPRAYAIVLATLLLARVVWHYLDLRKAAHRPPAMPVRPRPRYWSGELRVARIFDETHDVKTFRMVPVTGGPRPFEHQPGQYINLALTIDGKRVNRSYTIASAPSRTGYVEITVKRKDGGYASHHLHDTWREGTIVKAGAPAGVFHFAGGDAPGVLLIGGGVGVTPVMSMLRDLTDRAWPGQIYVAFAIRAPRDLIYRDELAYLAGRFPNVHLLLVASDADEAWPHARGRLSGELLTAHVPALATLPVYLCGPDPMMQAMRKLLVGLGVPDARVHTEEFVSPPTPAEGAADTPPALEPGETRLVSIRLSRAGKMIEASTDQTILEAAEAAGVELPFECRSGICGQCKTKLVAGEVAMEVQDALTAADRARGLVLACQARCRGDVVLDA